MQNLIKYHNDLNKLSFTGFTEADYNLFFAICSEVQGQEEQTIVFDYDKLKTLAGIKKSYTTAEFSKRLAIMNKKLISLNFTLVNGMISIDFVLFPRFKRNDDMQTLSVKVSEEGAYLLNHLKNNFTLIELRQFTSLESKYAKTLYRLLKQFKSTGDLMITAEDFRDRLGIPKAYTSKIITRDVIKPTVDALQDFFPHLTYDVIRSSRQGRPIKGYKFIFDADHQLDGQMSVNDYPGVVPESMQPHKRQRRKNANAGMLTHDYDIAALEQTLIHNK